MRDAQPVLVMQWGELNLEVNLVLGYGIKIFPQATFDHYFYLDGGYNKKREES